VAAADRTAALAKKASAVKAAAAADEAYQAKLLMAANSLVEVYVCAFIEILVLCLYVHFLKYWYLGIEILVPIKILVLCNARPRERR
jgi:hypothetical protein